MTTDDQRGPPPAGGSPARVFGVLWDAMADVMGSATTATLLRRAARRGARDPARAALGSLVIVRDGFAYRYEIPSTWLASDGPLDDVCALMRELQPLLVELTGPVVLRRLGEIPELLACGLTPMSEDP